MRKEEDSGFSTRLIEARERRGLSQIKLAELAGLHRAAIGHFERERRKPSFANVRALASALNVSADYLFGQSAELEGATTAFRGEAQLSHAERERIQAMIDQMNERREHLRE